jgi:hypothetical protein
MRIGRKVVIPAVITMIATAAMLVTAPSAMAKPSNCTISYPGGGSSGLVTSVCTGGTGYQQIDVVMYRDGAGQQAVVGNWAAVGQVSSVNVPWTIQYAFINLSN